MRGIKKVIERIKSETDVEWLKWKRDDAHRAADVAAIGGTTRDFYQLVDVENACVARIEQLEKEGESK